MACRSICRCQTSDFTAETRIVRLSEKQAAPPTKIAVSFDDLFRLASYNMKPPVNNRIDDKMISNRVDILLM